MSSFKPEERRYEKKLSKSGKKGQHKNNLHIYIYIYLSFINVFIV